jgi:hypothetical protein
VPVGRSRAPGAGGPVGFLQQHMAVGRSRALAGATGSVDVTEWVPDTPASAALGGRSGMTRRLCGTGAPKEANVSMPTPTARRSWPAPPPRRHPGRSRSEAEAQTRGPFRAVGRSRARADPWTPSAPAPSTTNALHHRHSIHAARAPRHNGGS